MKITGDVRKVDIEHSRDETLAVLTIELDTHWQGKDWAERKHDIAALLAKGSNVEISATAETAPPAETGEGADSP